MNARFYVPSVARFASADTIVPDKENPQAFNRYSYTANNPLKYVDSDGHCWGFASGLRNTFYQTTCENIDQAVSIIQHPNASAGEKALAVAYVGGEAVAHGVAAIGTGVAAVGCATGVGTAVCAAGGTAVTAASSADGDPSPAGEINAITQAVTADGNPIDELEAVQTGVNAVYQSVQNGITRYVGITNNFARRAAEHARTGRTIERIPGLNQLSRYDAKAVEQWLIESYGLPRNGGILENIYNSIAPTNPIYPEAIQRGLEILTKTGNLPQ